MKMTSLRFAVLLAVVGYCSAQGYALVRTRGYHAPVPATGRPTRYTGSSLQASDDSCRNYPGATCKFALLCLFGGDLPMGPCASRGVLYTCCGSAEQNSLHRYQSAAASSQTIRPDSVQTVKPAVPTDYIKVNRTKARRRTLCGIAHPKPQSRIIGGHDAMYGEFPWQAHIKLDNQQCGGVLLNNYYVLTAAHCIYRVSLSDISIKLGEYDIQDHSRQEYAPQSFTVVEKKIHPKFQFQQVHPDRYDVALLKLDKAARYHENVVPICLPQRDWNFFGWKATITGWGKTDSGSGDKYGTRVLQKVEVPIISNKQCEEWHHRRGIKLTISSEMLCAGYEEGGKDACVGDSGGPLMVVANGRWTLAGLVSAGFGCAESRQPGIYHRASHSVDWVLENIVS